MIKKPILSTNQYAVLMSDGATGHVLTIDGNICLNGEGEVYIIFDDLDSARKFVEQKQYENNTWEFVIYNSNNHCICHREGGKWNP